MQKGGGMSIWPKPNLHLVARPPTCVVFIINVGLVFFATNGTIVGI
jgi:hypothetical protein